MTEPMMLDEFNDFVHDFVNELSATISRKNNEYADPTDVLANFRETAKFLDCSMFESLLPHMYKHFRAIAKGFDNYSSEDLRDRLIDLCAYAIFVAMIKENNA